jgi:polyhydroxyalkanoate synthase
MTRMTSRRHEAEPEAKVVPLPRPANGAAKTGDDGKTNAPPPFPWLTAWTAAVEENAAALRPGAWFPWLSAIVDAKAQTTSAAPGPTEEAEAYLEGTPQIDRLVHAAIGQVTAGISPAALALAYADWATHLAFAPGKQAQLCSKALRKATRFGIYAMRAAADPSTPPCIEPLSHDRRFRDPSWQGWPFNLIHQAFLLQQQWWYNATKGVRGVSPHHENVVTFVARQLLDTVSPSNFLPTNPELLELTAKDGGQNLVRGAVNFAEDWERAVAGRPPVGANTFRAGHDVAVTPGKVIYRNRLIELIQYAPTTEKVQAAPILIAPAWIMKYYILDLSPHNSLVRYLVENGHTVFMISWRNPGAEDRDLTMDDYRRLGVEQALDIVGKVVPNQKIDAVGYCLGGTLLAIEAAKLGRDNDERLNSLTLLAAQTDFRGAGELSLFIDHSQMTFLEDAMWDRGYLDTKQMAGAFQMLRSNDLVWSRILRTYLVGQRETVNDLMAWNADATRMPYKMHSEYLRALFLNNDLAEGRYLVDARPVVLSDIRAPIFAVGTETDHVAPWRSVYKIHLQADTEVSFVLTKGGHNAGIVSEPGHPRRHYRVSNRHDSEAYVDPETWLQKTAVTEGSWWNAWQDWLAGHSRGQIPAPTMGAPSEGHGPICDAPGTYVLQP